MSKQQPELVEVAISELKLSRPYHTQVSTYGWVNAQGEPGKTIGTNCHAMCRSSVNNNHGVVIWSVTGNNLTTPVPDDIASDYFNWLCSEVSPWHEVLNNGWNTDPDFVRDFGVIITDLTQPANHIIATFAATRACNEHPPHILMWHKLCKAGLNPRWAFYLAGLATMEKGDKTVVFGMRSNSNHWPLWPTQYAETSVLNYLKHKTNPSQAFNAPGGGHMTVGMGAEWYGSSGTYSAKFKGLCKATGSSHGWDGGGQTCTWENFLAAANQEQERLFNGKTK